MRLHRTAVVLGGAVLALTFGAAGTAVAGQPGAGDGNACGVSLNALQTPGNSISAMGSAFNPGGVAGKNYAGNGPGSVNHANSSNAVSQYDIACVQVSK